MQIRFISVPVRVVVAVLLVLAISVAAARLTRTRGGSTVGRNTDGKALRAAEPVAVVNGTPIERDALDVRVEEMLPLASYHGNVGPERLLPIRRAALDQLVLDELIYREAIAERLCAPAAAVDAELSDVKRRFDDPAQFAAALAENGLTEAAFRERLARTVIVREARARHARQTITPQDIAEYYQANQRMFERPERVHLLEILVRRDPADPASRPRAEGKARDVLARLQRGEAFAPLARTVSEDEYRVKDGDMGFVHRGRLDAAFEAAVFAATPGRFEFAESLYGFQVFKVMERKPAEQLSFQEARPIIAERLERLRRDDAVRAWHAKLLAGARVEIRDRALRDVRAAQTPDLSLVPGSRVRPVAPAGSAQ